MRLRVEKVDVLGWNKSYANFAGGWAQVGAGNKENNLSCTGYVIAYTGYPIFWCSKLQMEIALNTTEAEYVLLIQAMRNVIPFMKLMKDISCIFNVNLTKTELFCKVFEDKQSCTALMK